MNKQRLKNLLLGIGFDAWPADEREWFAFTLAALCHAYKVGARGDDAITVANQFLADHGRKPLPAGFPTII